MITKVEREEKVAELFLLFLANAGLRDISIAVCHRLIRAMRGMFPDLDRNLLANEKAIRKNTLAA
jgi:hypothetical protein